LYTDLVLSIVKVTSDGYRGVTTSIPCFTLVDASNTPTMVVFLPPVTQEDVEKLGVKVGRTLVLKNAMVEEFADRRMGFTVRDLDTAEVRLAEVSLSLRFGVESTRTRADLSTRLVLVPDDPRPGEKNPRAESATERRQRWG